MDVEVALPIFDPGGPIAVERDPRTLTLRRDVHLLDRFA